MGMENMSNDRLSLRQCQRTLFLELFGVSVFLMTGTLVRYSGRDCFQYLLAGVIPVLLLALFYGLLSRKQRIPYGERSFCWKTWGLPISCSLFWLYAFMASQRDGRSGTVASNFCFGLW